MSSRLERAIKELAAALEETQSDSDWELVGEKSGESGGSSHLPCENSKPVEKEVKKEKELESTPCVPTGSDIAYHQDIRHYVVVEHPKGLVGYLVGPGASTWRALEATLPGRQLRGSGARLRRVDNRQEAMKIWEASHGSRLMPDLRL